MITGKINKMELPITIGRLERWLCGREPIQNVFPELTAIQREFLISGMSEEEQIKFYGK